MSEDKVIIDDDLFSISKRVKEIDENYFIVFDRKFKRFELHNKEQKNTLSLILSNRLDCSVLDRVRSTRREVVERLIREIERHNRELEERENVKAFDNIMNNM